MDEIKKGDVFFFNNAKVKILEVENEDFVLVCGYQNIHTELTGSQWCIPCMSDGGGHPSHTCGVADEIIESVIDDVNNETIFWVNIKHLQQKPIEYAKWEKLENENKELISAIAIIKEDILKLRAQEIILKTSVSAEQAALDHLREKIKELQCESESLAKSNREIIYDKPKIIKIDNSKFNISTTKLLALIKSELKLNHLDAGGVDNWEWYDESLPSNDEIENEALNALLGYVDNAKST